AKEDAEETKVKVHELAKELGIKSKDVIGKLKELGFEAKAPTSIVPEEAVKKLKK
ncbi:translation initiation factor IF-2 N-terminal domain-containing protein, partial [Candidatus Margulisiibacteriota bacterium]